MSSSIVIFNARVYLKRDEFAEAILIENGRIRLTGSNERVLALTPAGALRWDARGRTVLPGFIDTHIHLLGVGKALAGVPLYGAKSIADVKRLTREFMAERRPAPGTVIHGMGWNQDYFEDEPRLLTTADLDDISTEHPMLLDRVCGHVLTCNSRLLELAGVTRETPDPEGGTIGRNADGTPNGVFSENACALIRSRLPALPLPEMVRCLRSAMRRAAEMGITTAHTNDLRESTWRATLEAYEEVTAEEPLLRIYHQANFKTVEGYREFLGAGRRTGAGTPMHRFGPLKIILDGAIGARTALMREPYRDDPSTSGIASFSVEQIENLVAVAHVNGCSVAAHAIGDLAIERMLNAYERVTGKGMNPTRHGIVHAQITDRGLLERIRENDILTFVQPIFLHYDTKVVESRVGKDLASTSYAFGTMEKLGVHMSFGTDSPVEDLNPIDNIFCAVNRTDLSGSPAGGFHPEECVDVPAAVDASTIEGAYASFEEHVKGRLWPGYYADLVVLSEDIFTIPKEEIRRIRVDATMVDGRFVYERKDA